MENAPVISFTFANIAPGADADLVERYRKWDEEVYRPMVLKVPGVSRQDIYQVVRESFEYPQRGAIGHHKNLKEWEDTIKSPERIAIMEDRSTWTKRGVREVIWSAVYEMIKSFRSEPVLQGNNTSTIVENAPFIHFEAFRLLPEEQERYIKWLDSYGYDFISLFVRLPGLKGYDLFKNTGFRTFTETRETEYPPYLSIIYFENLEAFERYTKSRELIIFQKSLRTIFPRGLNYKWDVQYQLTKTWRK